MFGKVFAVFTGLTLFVACLGLFGLASFIILRRTREIGIRKILGASLGRLLWLLSNYFIRIVVVSALVAAPVSWWALNNHLQNYSYRISVPWWTLPATAVSLLVITLAIVLKQVNRAASENPVNALKSE